MDLLSPRDENTKPDENVPVSVGVVTLMLCVFDCANALCVCVCVCVNKSSWCVFMCVVSVCNPYRTGPTRVL